MAIAVDITSQSETAGSDSLTWSHTCTGANLVLYVGVVTFDAGGPLLPTSVTYNDVPMAELDTQIYGASDFERITLYRLVGPDTGAHDIVVSLAASNEIDTVAISLTGVNQADPDDVPSKQVDDNTTPATFDIASAAGDVVLDVIGWWNGTISVGANQNQEVINDNGGGNDSLAMSTEPGGATITMSWSWLANEYSGHIGLNVNAAAAGAAAGAFQGDAYQNDAYQVVITAGQVLVSVLDGIKFGEFTRMSAAWQALSGDGIRLGDGIGKQVHSFTIAVDGIKVGDAAYSILAQYAAAQDGAKFGDASAFGAHWYPRTLDGIRLGDLVLFTGDNDVFVADGLKLGDGAQAAAEMLARTADQIKFGDAGDITMTWRVSIADGVRFGDVITRILHYFTSLADGVKFRDQSRVNRPATGLLNISVGAKNAGLTFTVVNPGAGFSGTGPGAGFGADEPGVGFGTGQPGITIQGDG